jgi:hypothetical protein
MKTVRLYMSQDNRRWTEDIPYSDHLERSADLQMQGVHIYHASLIDPPKQKKRRTPGRLSQSLY